MTRILDLYFARSIIGGILISALLFAGLFFFIYFIKELKYVGTADYDIMVALIYVLLSLPQQLYELAPSIILVGSLISLGGMADSSEIVIIRAAGMSNLSITAMIMQVGLLVALFVASMGEFIIPDASSLARSMRLQAMNERVIAGGEHGVWSRDGNRYINIGTLLPDRQLKDIDIYEIEQDGRLLSSTSVVSAEPVAEGWRLHGIESSRFTDDSVESVSLDTDIVDHLVDPGLFDVLQSEPADMSAQSLYHYASYLEANELDAGKYQLQFWIKLFTPVTCVVMILIALPLVLNANARTGGTGQRVVIGLGIGILFFVFNRMVNYLGLNYGIAPAISAALPPLLVASVLVYVLRRQ